MLGFVSLDLVGVWISGGRLYSENELSFSQQDSLSL